MIAMVFILIARHCKERGLLTIFRAGLIAYLLFVLSCAYFSASTLNAALSFGLLYGLAAGLYWLPYHLFKFEVIKPELRLKFFSYEGLIERTLGIICPALFGWLIAITGSLTLLFGILATLFALSLTLLYGLKSEKPVERTKYDLYALISSLTKLPDLIKVLSASLLFGATFLGVIDVLLVLFIYKEFESFFSNSLGQSHLFLGLLFSALPLLEIAAAYGIRHFKSSNFPTILVTLSLLLLVFSVLLLFSPTFSALLAFQVAFSISVPVLIILQNVYSFNVLERSKEALTRKVEFFVLREIMLGIGRPLGFIISLICLSFAPSITSQTIMTNPAVAWLLVGLCALNFIGVLIIKSVRL